MLRIAPVSLSILLLAAAGSAMAEGTCPVPDGGVGQWLPFPSSEPGRIPCAVEIPNGAVPSTCAANPNNGSFEYFNLQTAPFAPRREYRTMLTVVNAVPLLDGPVRIAELVFQNQFTEQYEMVAVDLERNTKNPNQVLLVVRGANPYTSYQSFLVPVGLSKSFKIDWFQGNIQSEGDLVRWEYNGVVGYLNGNLGIMNDVAFNVGRVFAPCLVGQPSAEFLIFEQSYLDRFSGVIPGDNWNRP